MFKGEAVGLSANLTVTEDALRAVIGQDAQEGWLEFTCQFEATGEEYILFPACCYDGNRFDVLKKSYPPLFTPYEASVDMPITITDVPRLEKNGDGVIEVTTGDVSVPCIGVFSKEKKQAFLLYTIQEIDGINLGLSYEKGKIGVIYPHMRKNKVYRWPFMVDSNDGGIAFKQGNRIEIPYKLLRFPCEDITVFFKAYFENRKCMGLDDTRPNTLPFVEQFRIQKDKFNMMNWHEAGRFYGVGTVNEPGQVWQPGWVGGGMSSYALMKLGSKLEQERAVATLRHLIHTQAPSGFFHESSDEKGNVDTGFHPPGTENWHLIRKSADCLYFLFKHFHLMADRGIEIEQSLIDGTKTLADAFVRLWEKYGQFGQFVDLNTGEIQVGGSTSAGIAPAGLVCAYEYFGEEQYLAVAKDSAELYYTRDALNGYTTGGPGEILQCSDSESAFGLLESLVVLYEHTKEDKWLSYSEHVACLCSSWVVSYNYKFPQYSEFARLGMNTVGSVFANVQNKHAAPGICTLSGDSLYKLFQWTGNELYLELLRDIALTISQYMSTDERPIYSWDVPKDASLLCNDNLRAEPEKLPQGFICERVNMSDWESARCIGGVFNGSCWSEVSNLLTLAETINWL